MLRMNLKPVFAAKGIDKPNGLLRKNGFTAVSASDIARGKVRSIRLDTLEKLCLILNCTPHDFLEWEPGKDISQPKDFELSKLIKEKEVVVLSEELRGLSLAQIEEVHKFVQDKKREKGL